MSASDSEGRSASSAAAVLCVGDDRLGVRAEETVLEALERAGFDVPSGCRAGDCKKCLQRAEGGVPPGSQRGLRPTLVEQGYFLACQGRPAGEVRIQLAARPEPVGARVARTERHGTDVARLFLEPDAPLHFRPGQFVDVLHPGGAARSYSIASLPNEGVLELHVRRVPGGLVSGWLHGIEAGARLSLQGPYGLCHYTADDPARRLLLVGVGTGLAPLIGIARDALSKGHRGAIDLVHGALRPDRLYLREELERLCAQHPSLRVHFGVVHDATEREHQGDLGELAVRVGGPLESSRAYLCGDDALVRRLQRSLFLAGVPSGEIHSDPFTPSSAEG